MAMRPGDIVRESSIEEYEKLQEINRLLKTQGPRKMRKQFHLRQARKAYPRLFALLAACVVFSVGVYGYVALTFHVPPTPAHGVLANCGDFGVPSKSSVLINESGFQLVTCAGYAGLFHILAGTNATANYTLPSPYLDLYAYPAGQETSITSRCTNAPAAVDLSRPWTAGFTSNYSLCADYGPAGANGLPGFAVGWTVS